MQDYDLMRSYKRHGDFDFEAVSPSGERISPVYAVAAVALKRVAEGAILLRPEGYTDEVLDDIRWMFGHVERQMFVSGRQGMELSSLGAQLLELDKSGHIQPPLNRVETEAIERLVTVVAEAEAKYTR